MVRTNKTIAVTIAILLAVALTAVGCGGASGTPDSSPSNGSAGDEATGAPGAALTVIDAWARSAPEGDISAAYMTLANDGDEPVVIVEAASPVAQVVELHETRHEEGHEDEGGHATMMPVDQIVVPAGEQVSLEPGGLHIMLIGLVEDLNPGDVIPISLVLEDGSTVELEAAVE